MKNRVWPLNPLGHLWRGSGLFLNSIYSRRSEFIAMQTEMNQLEEMLRREMLTKKKRKEKDTSVRRCLVEGCVIGLFNENSYPNDLLIVQYRTTMKWTFLVAWATLWIRNSQTHKQTHKLTRRFKWFCLTPVWDFMWLYDCVWLCVTVYDSVWLCMTLN